TTFFRSIRASSNPLIIHRTIGLVALYLSYAFPTTTPSSFSPFDIFIFQYLADALQRLWPTRPAPVSRSIVAFVCLLSVFDWPLINRPKMRREKSGTPCLTGLQQESPTERFHLRPHLAISIKILVRATRLYRTTTRLVHRKIEMAGIRRKSGRWCQYCAGYRREYSLQAATVVGRH